MAQSVTLSKTLGRKSRPRHECYLSTLQDNRKRNYGLLKPAQLTTKQIRLLERLHDEMIVICFAELPFAPTRASATQIAADWITITWQPGGGPQVDSYTLYYRAKSASQWIVIKDIRGRTSMSLKDLQPFTIYQFRLFALNDLGTSKPSPLAEFTTYQKGLYFSTVLQHSAWCKGRRRRKAGVLVGNSVGS